MSPVEKEKVTYLTYGKLAKDLSAQLVSLQSQRKTRWDIVYGVATGGLPLAAHVAKALNLPVGSISAKRDADLLHATVKIPSLDELTYSCPLIVDDILDSGVTARAIVSRWNDIRRKMQGENLPRYISLDKNFAFLHGRARWEGQSIIGKILHHNKWIVYPWEAE
jgi:hypoxanthine phosphoribosyltransferase